jgi:two-component system, sensor histidine kinase LadS
MISRLYFLFFVFSIFANIAKADSHDYIIERTYFEDKTGVMSFEQAKDAQYLPIGEILSKGYSHSAFWIRLKIASSGHLSDLVDGSENKLILRIQPTYLDSIYLYDSLEPKAISRVVGDKHPLSFNEYESLNFNFVIPKVQKPRYVWLRLTTSSTNFLHVQALDIQQAKQLDRLQELVFAFYIGILFFLFFLPLIIWFLRKELLVGMFVLKQFGALVMVFFYAGYFRVLLKDVSPLALELAFNIDLFIYSMITIVFHYIFLSEYKLKVWAKYYFIFAALCFPVELMLLLNGDAHTALKLNMNVLNGLSIAFIVIPIFGIAWQEMARPIFTKKWLVAIHLLMFLFAAMTILPSLGYFQGNAFSPMAGMTYGGITGIIFLFVLHYRYRVNRDEVVAELSSATAYANSEKQRREEQGKFLTMLTHELKTPLSVLKMSYSSAQSSEKTKGYIQTAINDMTDVIDRCAMADKFESERLELNFQFCDLNKILIDKLAQYECDHRFDLVEKANIKLETDAQLLRIILDNLIGNALKYGKESEKIHLELSRKILEKKPHALITISNEAGSAGVPDADKVFEKYYRAPRAYEKTGSGLGLYLVKNFVELIGGSLQFSAKDNVVTFKVKLPLQGTSEKENS